MRTGTETFRRPDHAIRVCENQRHSGAGDGDRAIFQGLPQDVEGVARKLAEFVEEEQPIVRERDLAGTGDHDDADQSVVRGGVVRGTIGTLADAAAPGIESSYKAVDFGGLEGFFEGKWGKGSWSVLMPEQSTST
jgi:hypothetical protein